MSLNWLYSLTLIKIIKLFNGNAKCELRKKRLPIILLISLLYHTIKGKHIKPCPELRNP